MISATSWVPRGIPSEFPETYVLNDEEMSRINAMAKLNITEAKADIDEAEIEKPEKARGNTVTDKLKNEIEIDEDLKEYDFDHYDDDDFDENGEPIVMFPGLSNTGATLVKKSKDVKHDKNGDSEDDMEDEEDIEEEQYLQLPTEEEDLEADAELQVYPTDNMILATRTEDEVSYLDVYIYDDGAGALGPDDDKEEDKNDPDVARGMVREGNLYIHHDLMLPAFPLCVEWMSFKPKGMNDDNNIGNFAAIGTFEPVIELWNLDCIDKAFPDVILGEEELSEFNSKKSARKYGAKKKNNKKGKICDKCHTDAVLSLAHNKVYRNVLCSTSADSTVKLWDLTTCSVARGIDDGLHGGKHVSSCSWIPVGSEEGGSILLTGGYDGSMRLSDVRIENVVQESKQYFCGKSGEEVESVSWVGDDKIIGGTDSGNVYCYDIRMNEKPLWTLHAHDSGISTLTSNSFIDGLIVTGAMGEEEIKIWNVKNNSPSMVLGKDFGCGNVLSSSFANDLEVAGHLVIGGTSPGLKLWDCFSNKTVVNAFKDELRQVQNKATEEARKNNRVSRIARKYRRGYEESIIKPEDGGMEQEEDEEEDS